MGGPRRTVGGLDAFLLKARADVLSPRALELKRAIEKKRAAAAPEAIRHQSTQLFRAFAAADDSAGAES
jgi:hypothetical protein